jgi:alcohol dehydrogenase class IV
MRFEFATANRVIFGAGTVEAAAPAARAFGQRALVVIGEAVERAEGLLAQLQAEGLTPSVFQVFDEPKVETALAGAQQARAQRCEMVIALGGGSVLDTGKAVAALLTNPGDVYDYLEVVGKGQALVNPSAPLIAISTTAGTGAEVTRNAVLAATGPKVKVSLRSPWMLPRLAIVDPELTYSLPPAITASTGLDALTQLIEPFLSNAANPMTDALCREGMQRAARSLRKACEHGNDAQAREDLALASLFGGLALANAKLGAVHGFAGPIGGKFPAPHGAVCARLLPLVLEANWQALQARQPQSPVLQRCAEVAQILTHNEWASVADGIAWLQELVTALKIPPLAEYGMAQADLPVIVAQAQKASSMQGNPLELSEAELLRVLEQAL